MSEELFNKYGQTITDGRVIFKEGDIGNHMFIIQQGQVRISKTIDGRGHELAMLEKGDFFGEMALVSRINRTATATAVGEVRLLAFDREGFKSMIEKNSRIALNVIDKLCRRLQHANNQIKHLFRHSERNLVAVALYYRFMDRPQDSQVLTYDKLVSDISMSLESPPEVVTQAMEDIAGAGVIELKGNSVRLKDKGKLDALANRGDG